MINMTYNNNIMCNVCVWNGNINNININVMKYSII